MKKVIHSLTSYDQTVCVKGRYIGESVRLIDDLLKYAEDENIDGILFAADIEKAFDSVDHNFIYASLKWFGFGKDSCEAVIRVTFGDAVNCTNEVQYKLFLWQEPSISPAAALSEHNEPTYSKNKLPDFYLENC